MRIVLAAGVVGVVLGVFANLGEVPAKPPDSVPVAITGLRVQGNVIVNGAGEEVRLRGFNHSGAEYACVEGWGIFDTPDGLVPGEPVIRAMRTWIGANAVRVPLNEQCWLGVDGVDSRFSGRRYQAAVVEFVQRLNRNGFVAILDLHRSAPEGALAYEQEQLPDRDHSIDFWQSVAVRFEGFSAVVFDLFNEPSPFTDYDTERAWECWRDGGCELGSANSGETYVAAGMNELIRAIRATGSPHIVFAGGLHWAEVLSQWLEYRPDDPLYQLGASFHGYSFNDYCADPSCYDRDLARVAAQVPLLAGEIGPDLALDGGIAGLGVGALGVDEHCPASAVLVSGRAAGFADALFDWLDEAGASYTPWTWNPNGDCWALVQDWLGTPTHPWGTQVKSRLAEQP